MRHAYKTISFVFLGGLFFIWMLVHPAFQLQAIGFLAVCALVLGVLVYVGDKLADLETHKSCPQCGESHIRNIRRVPSGIQEDGSIENPIVNYFDDHGDWYVRKYNRVCKVCNHAYYVDEGKWPDVEIHGVRRHAPGGEPRLVADHEALARIKDEIKKNKERLRTQEQPHRLH